MAQAHRTNQGRPRQRSCRPRLWTGPDSPMWEAPTPTPPWVRVLGCTLLITFFPPYLTIVHRAGLRTHMQRWASLPGLRVYRDGRICCLITLTYNKHNRYLRMVHSVKMMQAEAGECPFLIGGFPMLMIRQILMPVSARAD